MTPLQEKVADKFKERKATKKYDEAVRHLLRTNPTLGVILLERLRPLVSYDCDCYYTNGVVIGYNPEAVLSMSILNNVFDFHFSEINYVLLYYSYNLDPIEFFLKAILIFYKLIKGHPCVGYTLWHGHILTIVPN